jgi:hypothetical protein
VRADGAYRTYQLPLRVFAAESTLTHEDLVTAGLAEFAVGGSWSIGSNVWVDDVAIRW